MDELKIKDELKRLKALLLALILCVMLGSCKKKGNIVDEESNGTIVFFIQGQALIYEGEYSVYIGDGYSAISESKLLDQRNTVFSSDIEAVKIQSFEDAVELAGEDNIIYIDYRDDDMQLTYTKKKNQFLGLNLTKLGKYARIGIVFSEGEIFNLGNIV